MNIISSREALKNARANNYAIPAFNFHNLEILDSIVKTGIKLKSPIMVATSPSTIEYIGLHTIVSMVEGMAKDYNTSLILHLDHAKEYNLIEDCINVGYKSIMIDGSKKSFEDNIKITKKVVEFAHKYDVVVEAELGKVGMEGEDIKSYLTDPKEALKFVNKTGIDSLAIAIGTAHGSYIFEPNLDFNRLNEINNIVDIPLVLHGASEISNFQIEKAIELGISKINISTELKNTFTNSLKDELNNSYTNDLRAYMNVPKEMVSEIVKNKILLCNSNNKY